MGEGLLGLAGVGVYMHFTRSEEERLDEVVEELVTEHADAEAVAPVVDVAEAAAETDLGPRTYVALVVGLVGVFLAADLLVESILTLAGARDLARDFRRVADHLDLELACTITRGGQPIGEGIGPVLEARDVLAVLEGEGPLELRLKSLRLADVLLDLCGVDADAASILDSGEALATFREIVAAQGGDPEVTRADLVPGRHTHDVTADRSGIVTAVQNRHISEVGRRAGAPRDPGAGLVLRCRQGDEVAAGDELFTIHAEKREKLADAVEFREGVGVVRIGDPDEALIERV